MPGYVTVAIVVWFVVLTGTMLWATRLAKPGKARFLWTSSILWLWQPDWFHGGARWTRRFAMVLWVIGSILFVCYFASR